MNWTLSRCTLSLFLLLVVYHVDAQSLTLLDVQINNATIQQYEKFEISIDLQGNIQNPYDYDEVAITALFTGPNGVAKMVDGFYMEQFKFVNESSNELIKVENAGQFKVRFAPTTLGDWQYELQLIRQGETQSLTSGSFTCTTTTNANNKGFIRTNGTNYLAYDNGDQYIAIGENMGWPVGPLLSSMNGWINKLLDNGGNFFRMWHAHWGLGIEWNTGYRDYEGLRRYEQESCYIQDILFDYCAENGMHVMLTLQHHGQVSTWVNPNWSENPYNSAHGGPCNSTADFFTNSEAIAHTKNRLRYIVARWGYSSGIMAWELFNEVEWTNNFLMHKDRIQEWLADMAAFLKETDPNNHIVTTSYAMNENDPVVWSNPDIDITQTHFYLNTTNLERAVAAGVRSYLDEYEKPTLTGEFGLGGDVQLTRGDTQGIHIHNIFWGHLFGGGIGTAMPWWWNDYINAFNLYYHYAPIGTIVDIIPFKDKNLKPTNSFVQGALGDLSISPSLDFGVLGDSLIIINEDGSTTPKAPKLGQYLYGSVWNTQYRNPPSFEFTSEVPGQFSVRTGTAQGGGARITIHLNDDIILDEAFEANQNFTIDIPAGQNLVMVENPGRDWATISAYKITDVGMRGDAYTLLSEDDQQYAAGWILNSEYNYQSVDEVGAPKPIVGASVVIEGLQDTTYFVHWYNCLTGVLTETREATAVDHRMTIDVPELYWDAAYIITKEANNMTVSSNDIAIEHLAFSIFPNPVSSGGSVTIQSNQLNQDITQITLLDISGRLIYESSLSTSLTLDIPQSLATGFYWIRIRDEHNIGVQPLVIR